jgi:hypothetical protein
MPDFAVPEPRGKENGERRVDRSRQALCQAVAANAPAGQIEVYYATDIIQEEFPNKLLPKGAVRDLNLNALCDPVQGPASDGHADVVRSMRGSRGDLNRHACLWFCILKPGDPLRARFAEVFEFKEV